MYYVFYIIRDRHYILIYILIQGNKKIIFFCQGRTRGGGNFVFSLLLEIRPSNINTNISILIKEIQTKYFLARGVPEGTKFIFSLLSEKGRLILNTKNFHINQRNSKQILFCKGRPRGGEFQFSLLLEIGPSNLNINISILI